MIPEGTLTRTLIELSYAWKISPAEVLALDDEIQATMIDILREVSKQSG